MRVAPARTISYPAPIRARHLPAVDGAVDGGFGGATEELCPSVEVDYVAEMLVIAVLLRCGLSVSIGWLNNTQGHTLSRHRRMIR